MLYKVSVSFHKNHIKIIGDHIEVGIMAKPVKGEANLEIITKIAKHFDIPKSNVRIAAGEKSRDKIVEVTQQSTKP
ncbi:MAG: DUF167 domain-containing protein [Nitrosopumilales archaeon]|nr:MAG: DUF167 domain-containing protein [Nitrosopumilales archaeon]